ncbi:hypothetical protein QBC43DRAFT_292728 [Cladorrhinum sp. PSN259]|nr:hypothetical protein QBC43DRAFT_292728 [Cladorrhinum sp. PSN259]
MIAILAILSRLEVLKALNLTLVAIVTVVVFLPRPRGLVLTVPWLTGLGILGYFLSVQLYRWLKSTKKAEVVQTEANYIYESNDLAYEAVHGYRSCGCPRKRCLQGVWNDPISPTRSQEPTLEPSEPEEVPQISTQNGSSGSANGSSTPNSSRPTSDSSDSSRGGGLKSRLGFHSDVTPPGTPIATYHTPSSSSHTIWSISTGRPGEKGKEVIQPYEILSPTSTRPSSTKSSLEIQTSSLASKSTKATNSSSRKFPAIMLDGATNSWQSERERYIIFNPKADRAKSQTGYDVYLSDYDGCWDVRPKPREEMEVNGALLSPQWTAKNGRFLDDSEREKNIGH